jgi:hypothetical protein
MGVVETDGVLRHIASYIRIMAVGLAGALFADAINQIVTGMGPDHRDRAGGRAALAELRHGAFSPLIHALRLNFLEFFGKFYETGNQPTVRSRKPEVKRAYDQEAAREMGVWQYVPGDGARSEHGVRR